MLPLFPMHSIYLYLCILTLLLDPIHITFAHFNAMQQLIMDYLL